MKTTKVFELYECNFIFGNKITNFSFGKKNNKENENYKYIKLNFIKLYREKNYLTKS